MKLLFKIKKLFSKEQEPIDIPPRPSYDEVIQIMYDKGIDESAIKVIYSKDNTKRVLLFKNEKNYYEYSFEYLYQFDEEEWKYTTHSKGMLPAMWIPPVNETISIFDTLEHALDNLYTEPYYKQYFE